jgi:hypothetical protein
MFSPNKGFYAIALDNPSVLDITVALQNVYYNCILCRKVVVQSVPELDAYAAGKKFTEQYVHEMQVQWVGKYCTICTEMDDKEV